jgi:hypothetical protein
MTIFLTGWRAVIGGVKAFSFKDYAHRGINLAQCNLVTNRADCQGVIGEMLKLVKSMTTMFAFITINWHLPVLLLIQNHYSTT